MVVSRRHNTGSPVKRREFGRRTAPFDYEVYLLGQYEPLWHIILHFRAQVPAHSLSVSPSLQESRVDLLFLSPEDAFL